MSTQRRAISRNAAAAASGLLAGYAALAVAELVSAAVRPEASPVTAVGGAVVDRTPAPVKDWAIRAFGVHDKLVLQLGILAVLALCAMVLGVAALRFRRGAALGVLGFGVLGAFAATGRPDSTSVRDAVPALAGAVVGTVVLHWLAGRLTASHIATNGRAGSAAGGDGAREAGDPAADASTGASTDAAAHTAQAVRTLHAVHAPGAAPGDGGPGIGGPGRRGFLAGAGVVAVASTGAGLLGRRLNARTAADAEASRAAVRLPAPASPAPELPRGVDQRLPGVTPYRTSNRDFYRVDTALTVPRLDAGSWRLRIHGRGVTTPLTLGFDDLLRRRLIERDITMTCVSNEVGGPYVGSARWLGAPLAALLGEAGVRPPSRGGPADQLVARSVDGMTIGTPVETVLDGRDALLAVGMNGEPLPFEHGFPVRMLVPGLYGYVSACKWIEDIELTTFDAYDTYWVERSWARRAPIKTASRIDTPKPFARLRGGPVVVAGVAWAQHKGIVRVEVRVDGGAWQDARLAAEGPLDTWRQWWWEWPARPGTHTVEVRATDRTGYTQTSERARPVPDGASGLHSVVVTVA
ncbi:molybdopterin-dependent oxidoreductase [Streptomyces sp. NPDC059788]|uniref:molybdopterin-dependent oxidoreductase n=1 Tax=Streptomyces sp. NPDC059788 TaxID=3346948 RepID=UPI003667EBE3